MVSAVTVYTAQIYLDKGAVREDILTFDASCHTEKLNKDLSFDDLINTLTRDAVKSIIVKYWDYFVKERAKNTIIGYEFGIETGGEKPICRRKPFSSGVCVFHIAN